MSSSRRLRAALVIASAIVTCASGNVLAATVRTERVPNGGFQPHAMRGADGTLHLVYLAGDPKASEVFYVRRAVGESGWSTPKRVNTQAGSAIGVGTIRGAQFAVGKGGRVHVVWNGSDKARPRPEPESLGAPLLYTRLNDAGSAFEPERNMVKSVKHLDGGGAVAADNDGNVLVIWHAHRLDGGDGEENRFVYVAKSSDDGRNFSPERPVNPKETGACACCGLAAFAARDGAIYTLFRIAREKENRDSVLLVSRDRGETFSPTTLQPWKGLQCPMSLPSITEGAGRVWLAWETGSQVEFAPVGQKDSSSPIGRGSRKHPVTAVNERGETLLAWSEGTGWNKGGAVEWQIFDAEGRPLGAIGRADKLPVWGLATALTENDGSFLILY